MPSEGIGILQKSLLPHIFLFDSSLRFVPKKIRQFKQYKSPLFFDLIPLDNAEIFLLQDNTIFFRLESLKE